MEEMLDLARDSILRAYGKLNRWSSEGEIDAYVVEMCHGDKPIGACFVTLKIHGKLRGCVGHLAAFEPLDRNIVRNSVSAAFKDTRFEPLEKAELADCEIEISVLSAPEPLPYTDEDDLLNSVKGKGVILSSEGCSATFLPQVWEQLPDAKEFLSHLAMKAGLSASAWKHADYQVYEVDEFSE